MDTATSEGLTVLQEAAKVVSGDRRQSYGDVQESFTRIALSWSAILLVTVTPEQVALCMIGLKLCREANKHHRDNIVDVAGYAQCLDWLNQYRAEPGISRPEPMDPTHPEYWDTHEPHIRDGSGFQGER